MQDELIRMSAAFLFSYYLVNVVVMKLKVRLKISRRIKPFDCCVCLSVWSALALWFTPVEVSKFLIVLFGAGFLSIKIQ